MQQYGDVVLKANPSGVATMGKKAEVTVYLAGTRNRASLFVDNGGTVLANPFNAQDDGSFKFCAADGTYDLYVGGVFIKTVTLFDPTAPTAASSVEFQPAGANAQVRTVQAKLRDAPPTVSDYASATDALNAGGLFAKDEAASGEQWYWGRNMTGAKTAGAGARNLGWGPGAFMFDVRSDSADCAADFMRGLYGRVVFGGSTAKGGRIGVVGEAIHSLGATSGSSANRNYVGVQGSSHSFAGDGGTLGAEKGAYFGVGLNAYADAGATNLLEVTAGEADTNVASGASVKYLIGWSIVGNNAVQGYGLDAALAISGSNDAGYGPHVGWNFGVCFTDINTLLPFNANSTLIGSYLEHHAGPVTVKAGFDASLFNCTNGIVLGPNLVLTDNLLALGANGSNVSTIAAGSNASAANLYLFPKGGGGIGLFDGASGTGAQRILVEPGAGITFHPLSNAVPANNGDVTLMLVNNTTLGFKAKGSDGVVRYGFVTLS